MKKRIVSCMLSLGMVFCFNSLVFAQEDSFRILNESDCQSPEARVTDACNMVRNAPSDSVVIEVDDGLVMVKREYLEDWIRDRRTRRNR